VDLSIIIRMIINLSSDSGSCYYEWIYNKNCEMNNAAICSFPNNMLRSVPIDYFREAKATARRASQRNLG